MSMNFLNKMKAINKTILLLILLILSSCTEEINRPIYQDDEMGQYVRFALILDNNGVPITDDILGYAKQYTNTYHHEVLDTVFIPVSLTSTSISEAVEVYFSSSFYGDDAHIVSFSPDSILTFGPNSFYDSIEIVFSERWFPDIKDSIVLQLEHSNNPNISIGYPFNDSINDHLTIHLDEIKLPITVRKPNEFEVLSAIETDTFDFYVDFENGFIENEIKGVSLFKEVENNLDYTLVQHPYDANATTIAYSFILNTPIADKFESYNCLLELENLKGYIPWGRTTVSVDYQALKRYSYTLSDQELRINGNLHENVSFDIELSSPIDENVIEDLRNQDLVRAVDEEFDYTLSQQSFNVGDSTITYVLELNESLVDSTFNAYTTTFELIGIDGFTTYGNTEIEITKERFHTSNSPNPAAIFYNDSYPANYSQLWHYMWIYSGSECKWRESFQLCYPVEVDADHPNAVLHSNGNYYHAFRFGFNSPNLGRTVNSFGLKSLFDNEYTDADKSPGFNIPEALELFPEDGTSRTNGSVIVLEQDLTISSKNDESFVLSIAGEGSYSYDEGSYELYRDSIYTIKLFLEVTNEELFGGTRIIDYMFKNRDLDKSDKPDYEYDSCSPVVDLNTVN